MKRGIVRNIKLLGMWVLNLPIVLLSYFVVWLDRHIRFPMTFPRDLQELTKKEQWCIKQLKKNGALPKEAEVYEYKVTPLKQEMIFRSVAGVIALKYKVGDDLKALPCFAKFAPTSGTVRNRTVFNIQLNHVKEGWFNQEFVKDDCVAAPDEMPDAL